jgi:hypothetical protein
VFVVVVIIIIIIIIINIGGGCGDSVGLFRRIPTSTVRFRVVIGQSPVRPLGLISCITKYEGVSKSFRTRRFD